MIRVDFDQPAYLRASNGLAILSSRLQHLLPKQDIESQTISASEPVIINRLYNGLKNDLVPACEAMVDETVKGEFLPLDCDSASSDESSEQGVELSFGGIKGKSVSGQYGGSGFAHYRFNKNKGKSFFVRVGKHIIWGIDLAPEIRRCGVEKGQHIEVTFLGKEPVTVLKEIDVNGQKSSEWINTHKNLWQVTAVG